MHSMWITLKLLLIAGKSVASFTDQREYVTTPSGLKNLQHFFLHTNIFHNKFQNQRKTTQALSVYRKGTFHVYIKCLIVILIENDAKSLSKAPCLVALRMSLTLHLSLFAQSM